MNLLPSLQPNLWQKSPWKSLLQLSLPQSPWQSPWQLNLLPSLQLSLWQSPQLRSLRLQRR